MSKIHFKIEGDVVVRYTPIPEMDPIYVPIYKTEVVMTKDIFQECYKKWIEGCIEQEVETDELS